MKINVRLVAGVDWEGRDLRRGLKLVLHSVNGARRLGETPPSATSFSCRPPSRLPSFPWLQQVMLQLFKISLVRDFRGFFVGLP